MLLKEYSPVVVADGIIGGDLAAAQQGSKRNGLEGTRDNLPVNCVLQQILNVQRRVYDFFSTIKLNGDTAEAAGVAHHQDQCPEDNNECSSNNSKNNSNNKKCDNIRNGIVQAELLKGGNFKQYQYGATALDCSLMITFQRISGREDTGIDDALTGKFMVEPDEEEEGGRGMQFLSKITIMDLDPKPFTHALKYVEQTQASYQTEWSRRAATIGFLAQQENQSK